MGIEVVPVLEDEGFNIVLGGHEWKWMCDAKGRLHDLARQLSVTPLNDFISYAREDAVRSMGEEYIEEQESKAEFRDGVFWLGDDILWPLEPRWHTPEAGLETARALLSYLRDNPDFWTANDALKGLDEGLPYILEAFEGVMLDAQTRGKKFYLYLCV